MRSSRDRANASAAVLEVSMLLDPSPTPPITAASPVEDGRVRAWRA